MAYSVREERQSLANSLREEFDEAERLIIQLRRDNVESFLQLLDRVDERFIQLAFSGIETAHEPLIPPPNELSSSEIPIWYIALLKSVHLR